MLEARGVSVVRGGRRVLEDVSLKVIPGEFVALCGPNGAGKSSLLAVLAGELRPGMGEASLDGRPLSRLPAAALAAERAVLEQVPSLAAAFTVAALVDLGLSLVPRADIDAGALRERALRAAGVEGLATRAVDRLSGGERARAHLARVLVQLWAGRATGGGRYLLLDEPTASLDIAHQLAVMRAARVEAGAGAGVLCVLHDLNLAAAFADRVVLMQAGRIVADGAPEDALDAQRLSGVYASPIAVERTARGLRVFPEM